MRVYILMILLKNIFFSNVNTGTIWNQACGACLVDGLLTQLHLA